MKCPHINPTVKDCNNCPFDDCINDDLSLADYQDDVLSEEVPDAVKKARIRANRYAEKHREENRVRALKYYYNNKEASIERDRKWQKENKSRVAAAKRERYHKDIETARQYQRDYKTKKKAERVS